MVRVGLQSNALSIAASCSPNDDQNRAGHDSTFVVARPRHPGVHTSKVRRFVMLCLIDFLPVYNQLLI